MKDLSSYIPESLHTHQKRQTSCRLFLEDLAVVEPERDFRILASRGKDLPLGADFFKTCGVLSRDAALLRSHPQRQKRFLLPSKRGCVLMLGDLLSETGLFVGLLLSQDAADVLCALLRMGHDEFASPDELLPCDGLLPRPYDEVLCDGLEELFYYLDRILCPTPEASLWTRCLLIANFVGCRLERVAFPVEAPRLSKADDACMTLFLLCSFLALRQKSGRVQAAAELHQESEKPANYQCTVSFFEEKEEPLPSEEPLEEPVEAPPLFSEHSCFSRLSLTPTEEGLILETRFFAHQEDFALGAVGEPSKIRLRFVLFCTPYVENQNVKEDFKA